MANIQNINELLRTYSRSADMASKTMAAATDAVIRFLESRSFANREALILTSHVKQGGQLGCMTMDQRAVQTLRKMLRNEKLPSVIIKFEQKDGTSRYGMIYRKEDEAQAAQIREKYLASRHLVFQLSKENLRSFSKNDELHDFNNLTYAEMCNLKSRMVQNQIMFSADKKGKNSYTVIVRKEDKDIAELLRTGVKQEREGTGQKVYKQMDYERERRQEAVNIVMAERNTPFLAGNHNGSKILYINKEGVWFEQEGGHPMREFISREDDHYEQKLCRHMDRIRCPKIIRNPMDKEHEELFRQRFCDPLTKDKVMDIQKSMELYGISSLKELDNIRELKRPEERLKEKSGGDLRELEAAYCRLKNAMDLSHTGQENGWTYVSEAERQPFEAEQQIRREYEYCIIRGYGSKGDFAQQYRNGTSEISKMKENAEKIQKEKHFTVDDMRRRIVWREAYEMPDYADKDRDNIFDEFDQDIIAREAAEHENDYEEQKMGR